HPRAGRGQRTRDENPFPSGFLGFLGCRSPLCAFKASYNPSEISIYVKALAPGRIKPRPPATTIARPREEAGRETNKGASRPSISQSITQSSSPLLRTWPLMKNFPLTLLGDLRPHAYSYELLLFEGPAASRLLPCLLA
ncbi:hypothetical protein CLAIMM_00307, partial [Cladophialophora immunda]